MASSETTVLIVPGLRDHVPEHWQTLLQTQLERRAIKVACVPRRMHDKLSCTAWVAAIQQSMQEIDGRVVLVAHSGGVMMVAHWAQLYERPVHGALLATPADLETPLPAGYPTLAVLQENGWLPIPRQPLPFKSIVTVSTNDPLARYERVLELAGAWQSEVLSLGAVGHLNPASGYGPWPEAEALVDELCK